MFVCAVLRPYCGGSGTTAARNIFTFSLLVSPGDLHSAVGPPANLPDGAESRYEAVQFGVRLRRVPDLQDSVSSSRGEAVAGLKCTLA